MPRLTIFLFGPFQVFLDGVPVSGFTSKKAQALLAYLAVETRPHGREELAGLLWPDYPEASARANLRSVLANVRRVIGDRHAVPSFLHISRQTIHFNLASDCQLDVAIFDRLAAPDPFDPRVISELAAAVAQVQDAFLAGFSLSDSPPFEEWLLLKREYYGRQVSKALRYLTHHNVAEKAYAQALVHARHWVKLDPWQEEGHQQVMRLLALSGRRSEALAHCASCRRVLIEELGVEPSDETTLLFEQIHDGALHDAGAVSVAAAPHAIPRPLTPLIGREQALVDLRGLLADPAVRLLTVVGPGGIGKTHLALEAAAAQQPRFQHGAALVSLAPLASAAGLVSTIAQALNFSFYENVSPQAQILDYLREKDLLLVMDNFEHLLEGAGLVTSMLETAPGLKILTTSRIRLQIQGEQLYPLEGLTYPNDGEQWETLFGEEGLQHFGALTLFVHHARRLHPDFVLTPDTVADVTRICRLVQGMPLGIVLAAAWIEMLTPGEIADEITRSFTFLQVNGQGLPTRHQNIEAVFEHTWSLLTAREQTIFQQSSIFRGGFTQKAVTDVIGATLADLLALVNKFLLHRSPNGRYAIHELLRQFAAQKLDQSPADETAARQRHSAFFSAYLQQHEDGLNGPRQQQALSELEAEGENLRVAWRWAVEHREIALLDQAINCLGMFYEWRGRYHDGEMVCRTAVEMLSKMDRGDGLRVRVKILNWQARFSRLLGQGEIANRLARQSLGLLNEPALIDQDVRPEQAATLLELGQQAENVAEIKAWFERSLAIYRALKDAWGTARVLYLRGSRLGLTSVYEENPQILEESLQLHRSLGNQRGIAEVLAIQGFHEVLQGQAARGEKLLQQSLTICQEIGDKAILADSLGLLGIGSSFGGKFEEAHHLYSEELEIWRDLGNRPKTAGIMAKLSEATSHLGRYDEARSIAENALKLCLGLNEPWTTSYALWFLGLATLAEGSYVEAEQSLTQSIAMHKTIGWDSREHDVMATLGFALLKLGELDQARQTLSDVLEMALENHFFRTSVEGICLAACFSTTLEEPERAVELYALAQRYPYIANSRWFEDVAGPHIVAAAELLSPEVVTAAQERGKAHDLWVTVAELLEELAH